MATKLPSMKNALSTLLLSVLLVTSGYSQMTPLGTGLTVGANDYVYEMLADTVNDLLYVGGRFTSTGTLFTPFISAWDGTNWSGLSTGMNGNVWAMCFFEGDLIVGGEFTEAGGVSANRIARWDGTTWETIGDGFNNDVRSLCVFNGQLFAGGFFTMSGSDDVNIIARWNGTDWESFGGGLIGAFTGYTPGVHAMHVYQNHLFIGGYFSHANSTSIDDNMVKWNGFSFIDVDSYFGTSSDLVLTLSSNEGYLWAGGYGLGTSAEVFDGTNWLATSESPLPTWLTSLGSMRIIDFYEDLIVIGGSFTSVGNSGGGSIYENEYIYYVENEAWHSLDGGVNNYTTCSAIYHDQLYVGGAFTRINQDFVLCNHIAKWITPLEVEFAKQHLSCYQSNDGAITLTPINGTAPYVYTWDDIGVAGATRSGLAAGTYTCTITDVMGRVKVWNLAINSPSQIVVSMNVTGTSGLNGSIQANVTGGSPAYSYLWDTGETTSAISGLAAGTYNVSVEDDNDCPATASATVDTLVAGIDDPLNVNWSIFPNPVSSFVRIKAENTEYGQFQVDIYDLLGKSVIEPITNLTGTTELEIDIEKLPVGSYFISITDNDGFILHKEKLIKQ